MLLEIIGFYVLSFVFLIVLGGGSQAVGIPVELGLAQWGPAIGALLTVLIFRKDQIKISLINRETPVSRYLLALGIPFGAAGVIYLLSSFLSFNANTLGLVIGNPLLFALWTPFGALGEEIGWRGYLHKRLDGRMRGIISSVIVGIMWMPIHVNLFANGALYMFFVTLLIISYSIILYALTKESGFNVLLASVFHMGINLSNFFFLSIFNDLSFMILNASVWLLLALISLYIRKDLFFSHS